METGNTVERGGKLHCMDQATSVGGKSVSRAFVGVQNVHVQLALTHTTEATEMADSRRCLC